MFYVGFKFVLLCVCFIMTHFFGQGIKSSPLILTPYLKAGNIEEARILSRVRNFTNAESYSGYFTVNPLYNSNLFFWFFPSIKNPETAPVLLWLEGGPGVTGMNAIFNSIGPFVLDKAQKIMLRRTSWTLTHSVIFIDNPVGTGFSFTDSPMGYSTTEEEISNNLYKFLKQFFRLFPMYARNDFFLTGQSYGGKFMLGTAYKIYQENQRLRHMRRKINLKGIALGNAYIDPINMLSHGDHLYSIGLIDGIELEYFQVEEEKARILIRLGEYKESSKVTNSLFSDLERTGRSYFTNVTGYTYYYNILLSKSILDPAPFVSILNQPHVRSAIHAKMNETFLLRSIKVINYLQSDIPKSMTSSLVKLLNAPESYRILFYNGNLDIVVPPVSTEEMFKHLKWRWTKCFLKAKKLIWKVNDNVAGYYKAFKNLGFLVVRNAGHIVSIEQTSNALDMINRFTSGNPIVENESDSLTENLCI